MTKNYWINQGVLALFVSFFIATGSFAQVTIGGEQEGQTNQETTQDEKPKKDWSQAKNELFISAFTGNTFRTLEVNEGLFGDSLGFRADEASVKHWSFGIGLRSQIHPNVLFEGGISYLQNGENYSFEASDSDSSYTRSADYAHMGLPIKVYGTYGKVFRLQAGVGIIPQLNFRTIEQSLDKTAQGFETETTKRLSSGINQFTLAYSINAGIQYSAENSWGVFAMFEYRRQLTSTFDQQSPYIHKANAIGVQFGLTKKID